MIEMSKIMFHLVNRLFKYNVQCTLYTIGSEYIHVTRHNLIIL